MCNWFFDYLIQMGLNAFNNANMNIEPDIRDRYSSNWLLTIDFLIDHLCCGCEKFRDTNFYAIFPCRSDIHSPPSSRRWGQCNPGFLGKSVNAQWLAHPLELYLRRYLSTYICMHIQSLGRNRSHKPEKLVDLLWTAEIWLSTNLPVLLPSTIYT